MELQSRKYNLIRALVNLNDVGLLQKLETVLSSHQEPSTDWWNQISDEKKAAINEGIDQLDQGNKISHREMRKLIDSKLGK